MYQTDSPIGMKYLGCKKAVMLTQSFDMNFAFLQRTKKKNNKIDEKFSRKIPNSIV